MCSFVYMEVLSPKPRQILSAVPALTTVAASLSIPKSFTEKDPELPTASFIGGLGPPISPYDNVLTSRMVRVYYPVAGNTDRHKAVRRIHVMTRKMDRQMGKPWNSTSSRNWQYRHRTVYRSFRNRGVLLLSFIVGHHAVCLKRVQCFHAQASGTRY